MRRVWSLVFFGMAAAKVGCKKLLQQIKVSGWPGQITRKKPRAQSNWHLSLGITEAWRTMQLRMGFQESSHLERHCQEYSPMKWALMVF